MIVDCKICMIWVEKHIFMFTDDMIRVKFKLIEGSFAA